MCGETFLYMCDFESHPLEHVNKSLDDDSSLSESFSCETCSETFVNRSGFEVHSFQHIDIAQLDGNVSVSDEPDASNNPDDESFFTIPVLISSRMSSRVYQERGTCCNRSIIRDNKHLEALNLPTFTVNNMRTIWSKLDNLAEDIHERSVDISILSEVWEKKENLKHQSKIEELLELKGISYISPRPGLKRGGGSAIAACPKKFSLVKLHIAIPKSLEVVWGLLRPKKVLGSIKKIIICSFYSPPRSKKKTILIDHILTVLSLLRTEHPGAATIIAGDKNDLDESGILAFDPAFFQIVNKPTRKDSLLSIIITDLRRFYVEPRIVDPIPVDEGKKGAPSDHNGVLALPVSNIELEKKTSKELKYVRPMPESSIGEFTKSIDAVDWSLMMEGLDSSEMVDIFQKMSTDLQDIHFPLKKITVTSYDRPWMTEELKKLRRQRQRIYRKEGRSVSYLEVKRDFDEKLKAEAARYMKKIHEEISNRKRGSFYAAIRDF